MGDTAASADDRASRIRPAAPWVAPAVFVLAFATYAWTASAAMGWLDAPELIAASASLGVPHSPGEPLVALIGKLGALIPIGDVTLRVNLMSAAAAALACVCLLWAARGVLVRVAPALDPRARDALAAAAALALAGSRALWLQGVRAEVYALQAVFVVGAMAAAIRYERVGDPRAALVAGLLGGLALATHNLIAALFLVPAAALLVARRPSARCLTATATLGVLGLAALLYLPVRSTAHPVVNWGAPHTAERFAWTVSAKAFQKSATAEHVSSRAEDAAELAGFAVEQLTPVWTALALLALYLAVRRPGRHLRLTLLLVGVAALSCAGRVMVGFDVDTPDHVGYLIPAIAALLLLGVAGAGGVVQLLHDRVTIPPRKIRALVAVAALALLAVAPARAGLSLSTGDGGLSRRGADASDAFARWELETLPPRTLLLPAYFQTSFRLWALQTIDHSRPDVEILDRSFLTYPGTADELRRRHPDLAALIDAPLAAGRPTPIAMLRQIARARPVAVQLHINLDNPVYPWLVPAGAFARLVPEPPTERARDAAEAADARSRQALVARLGAPHPGDRLGLRDALLWHDATRLELFCRQRRLRAAQRALNDAWTVAPRDETLIDMATECGLELP